MVQIVNYYFSYFRVLDLLQKEEGGSPEEFPPIRFAVPSGGFGNCVAGYIAKEMGLPIELHACVNDNVSGFFFFALR